MVSTCAPRDERFQWSEPADVYRDQIACGPAAGRNFPIDESGRWSNCDVYVEGDTATWFAVGVVATLFAKTPLGDVLIDTVDLSTVAPTTVIGTTTVARVFRHRGGPCLGYRVEIRAPAAISDGRTWFTAWGTESLASDTSAALSDTISNRAPSAFVGAFQLLWDAAASVWERMRSDGNGNLSTAEAFMPQYEDNTNGVAATVEKPLATSTYAPSLYQNLGTSTTASVKGSAGNVLALRFSNDAGADRWVQLHNKASAPAGGDTALISLLVRDGETLVLGTDFFAGSGLHFSTGIGWCVSTTDATFTDTATAGQHETHIVRV